VQRHNGRAGGVDDGFSNEDDGLPSSALSFLSVSTPSPSPFSIFDFVLLLPSSTLFFLFSLFGFVSPLSVTLFFSSPSSLFLFFFLLWFLCIISLSLSSLFCFFLPVSISLFSILSPVFFYFLLPLYLSLFFFPSCLKIPLLVLSFPFLFFLFCFLFLFLPLSTS